MDKEVCKDCESGPGVKQGKKREEGRVCAGCAPYKGGAALFLLVVMPTYYSTLLNSMKAEAKRVRS